MAPPQGFMVVSQKIEATQFDEGFAAGIGQQSEPWKREGLSDAWNC